MNPENLQIVATLYKFVKLPDFRDKQQSLLSHCQGQGVKGTILLSLEGINGTIAGSQEGIESVMTFLRSDPQLADLGYQQSYYQGQPFEQMKVKLKREIVTMGVPEVDPTERVGTYVTPQEWNDLICDPEVTVIDTRNDYEVRIGTFQKAQNPHTKSFRDFPVYVSENLNPNQHKKVALFCTGGIRCEKATSFLLSQGFEHVYHLKGGILKYLKEVPPEASLWQGECFVFDERIAVGHGLEKGSHQLCFCCGHPISETDKVSSKYEEGISCDYCFDGLTEEKTARQREKWKQYQLLMRNSAFPS